MVSATALSQTIPDTAQQSSSHQNLVFVSDFPPIKSPNPSFSSGSCAISCLKEKWTAVKADGGKTGETVHPGPRQTVPALPVPSSDTEQGVRRGSLCRPPLRPLRSEPQSPKGPHGNMPSSQSRPSCPHRARSWGRAGVVVLFDG